ncbi:MAG: hypothetical protein IIZ18_08665 [Ruminococcus sp.]|nr:hypothetical protein [Ruminococcus sp.]
MHERLNTGIKFGFIGNVLFIVFGMLAFLVLKTFDISHTLSRVFEALAYICEFSAFSALAYAEWCIATSVRMRTIMKVGFAIYTVFEAVMMFLELKESSFDFYRPFSLYLAIAHAVISAAACFCFLQLDPDNTRYEILVTICVGMILGGMLGNFLGIRVYFSIVVNAVSFAVLFYSILRLIRNEEIEIDCHGDAARVVEYSSTFFYDHK